MPPVTTTSTSPARIIESAISTARIDDAHTLFTVSAGTSIGSPAPTAAWRAGASACERDTRLEPPGKGDEQPDGCRDIVEVDGLDRRVHVAQRDRDEPGSYAHPAQVDGVCIGIGVATGDLDRERDPLGLGRLVQELEDPRVHGRAAHERGAASEPAIAIVLRVSAAHVRRVRDIDRDRDCRLEHEGGRTRAREVADLLLYDRQACDVAGRSAFLGDAARDLERDVRTEPVVEGTRGDPVVAEVDRHAGDDGGVTDTDDRPRLLAVLRADVEIQIGDLERLAILTPLSLLLARADHSRNRPLLRQHVETLPEQHVRVEPPELANRDQAVVACVRDDEGDLVDVADDRDQRPFTGSGHPDPRGAEHVARDLAERRSFLPPHRRYRLLLPRGARSREQPLERLRDRHDGADSTPGAVRSRLREAPDPRRALRDRAPGPGFGSARLAARRELLVGDAHRLRALPCVP